MLKVFNDTARFVD